MEIKTISSLLAQNTNLYPNKVAVETKDCKYTYYELNELSSQISNAILSINSKESLIVGVVIESGIELVAGLWATWLSNSIYTPLDLNYSDFFLKQLLSEAKPSVLICNKEQIEKIHKLIKINGFDLNLLLVIDLLAEKKVLSYRLEKDNFVLVECEIKEQFIKQNDKAYLFYTSGSTGEPKGVLGSRSSINHFINWEINEFNINQDFRISQLTSPTFDASLRDILVPLCAGATLVIPSNEVRYNSALMLEWIIKNEITLIHCVPTMFRLIYSEFTPEMRELTKLKYVLLAGEPLYNKDVLVWREYVKDCLLINLYGTTETTLIKTFYRIDEVPTSGVTTISVGKPIEDCKIAIIKNNRICKINEEGEIYIKTKHKSLGYYNNPDATKSVFVQNPLLTEREDIIYYTGDIGRFDNDFNLHICGRKDERLKINGVLIEPKAIEKAILSLDGIREVVVIAREKHNFEKELIAYYTSSIGIIYDFHLVLDNFINRNQIPTDFIYLEKLPLTQNGKVDRKQLVNFSISVSALVTNNNIPETVTEFFLQLVWEELLSKDQFGIEDSFFVIGGSSLKAIQLISRVYKEYQVLLNIRDIFQHNSIRTLGRLIEEKRGDSSNKESDGNIKLAMEKENYPLSFGQQRIWLQHQIEEGKIPYNITRAFIIQGELNVDFLRIAFLNVIKRQEGLRTIFIRDEQGLPRQKIIPSDEFEFNIQRHIISDKENEKDFIESILLAEEVKLFDLENGPLFSVILISDKTNECILSFSMHHIIGDYWSLGLFANEFTFAYSSLLKNRGSVFEALPLQYKDFAEWQYNYVNSERFESSMKYWQNQLKNAPMQSTFQHDRQRPNIPLRAGDSINIDITPELSNDIIELAQNNETTLYTTLLSLFFILLNEDSGQEDLVIGSPVAGRSRKEFESIIGFFLNTIAIRVKIHKQLTITDVIKMVKDLTMEALVNQEVPFDSIVNNLAIKRNVQYSPLFQCILVFQNTPTGELELEDVTINDFPTSGKISKNDITFCFAEIENRIQGLIEYNTELYDHSTIELLIMKFKKLMFYACEYPNISLFELDLLPSIELSSNMKSLLDSELNF